MNPFVLLSSLLLIGCSNAQKETTDGNACIFPFKSDGTEYTDCTTAGTGTCWCPTLIDSNDMALISENCKDTSCTAAPAGGSKTVGAASDDNSCATDTDPCAFPFKYNDKLYTECTTDGWPGTYWCGTKVNEGTRQYVAYSKCKDNMVCKSSKADDLVKEFAFKGEGGPQFWGNDYNENCKSDYQSPINIDTDSKVINAKGKFNSLTVTNFDKEIQLETKIMDEGGPLLRFKYKSGDQPTVTGGPAGSNTYKFHHFMLRWGSDDRQGSEHTIDKARYPGELQLVFYSDKYKKYIDAVNGEESMFIMSYMIDKTILESAQCSDSQFNELLDDIKAVDLDRKPTDLKKKHKLEDLFKLKDYDKYYTYIGSLTYPPCTQKVIWYVHQDPKLLTICKDILEALNKLEDKKSSKKLGDNFRDTQPLNGRKVVTKSA